MHLKSRYGTRLETKLSVPLFSRPEIKRTTLEMCPKRVHFSKLLSPFSLLSSFLKNIFFPISLRSPRSIKNLFEIKLSKSLKEYLSLLFFSLKNIFFEYFFDLFPCSKRLKSMKNLLEIKYRNLSKSISSYFFLP